MPGRTRPSVVALCRDSRFWTMALFGVAVTVGIGWGLPGPDTWCVDSISPRSVGLGAIVETYRPGHFHTYPPLHMALLSLLSLPWILAAVARVGPNVGALGPELVKPLYMTGIESTARLVAAVMATFTVWNTMRLWTRIAGPRTAPLAALALVCNATFVYYAHTGNLDVPCLFWILWALVEIDRVTSGERREVAALLLCTCAALTKDQGAAALILPVVVYMVVLPWRTERASMLRPDLVRGAILSVGLYALVSGALVNPIGFGRRLAFLFGPASQTWAEYPKTLEGAGHLLRDIGHGLVLAGSPLLATLATAGVLIALASNDRRARLLLPLCAAVSFTLLFNLSARRTDDRFLLPQGALLYPYAALAIERAHALRGRARPTLRRFGQIGLSALAIAAYGSALLGGASLDATLVTDARYRAESFLQGLPPGTRIDVVGSTKYLPRIPGDLVAVRPGIEPVSERQQTAGISEWVDPTMDPRPRGPEYIVLASELSNVEAAQPPTQAVGFGLATYHDPVSRRFLRRLLDGSLGYGRVLRAGCALPWPLACRHIHGSTGGDVWIYKKALP